MAADVKQITDNPRPVHRVDDSVLARSRIKPGYQKYDADTLARMRQMWAEHPELSAAKIGERFGITGNSVKGLALRRGWVPRAAPQDRAEPRTTFAQRIDAMHARMDKMLAATRPQVDEAPP